eukprot:m.298259 g.298259  ORF g.298259 m.298259 type:complete len:551 (-) comp16408_c0_seq1:2695-4347(-)
MEDARPSDELVWVEILEPTSKHRMYANVTTGECQWERPECVEIRPTHANQWWELKDTNTNTPYYYNASSETTVWSRPAGTGTDIIPLERLQAMQEKLAALEDESTDTPGESFRYKKDAKPSKPTAAAATPTPAAAAPSSSPPADPSGPPPGSNDKLDGFKAHLSQHQKGFIFKRKVSLASMLSWSKSAIKKPMLLTLKKAEKKTALDLFKLVQMYMGDRNARGRDPTEIGLTIVASTWNSPPLRDEVYLQLCKQTTENNNINTLEKGWELICILLNFIPPSNKFFSYLQGYIYRHTNPPQRGRVLHYGQHSLKKLSRINDTGARRGTMQPTLIEVQQAQKNIFDPSMFGGSLDEVMEAQQKFEAGRDRKLPWAVTALVDAILEAQGAQTEGIFRVPGDIDAVNILKVRIDRGEPLSGFSEPHVPASALKLWFRELSEPLIPQELYYDCIEAYQDVDRSMAIIERMPALNRLLLVYIIRFLQIVGQPENQTITKMTLDNLSMVWAPNFLRCPSEDPMTIFQNTKKEMSFLRNLVVNLDTSEASELGLPQVN